MKDVSFELKRGECLGLIGRNGAGKTTLLRILNGLIKLDKGRVEMRGRIGALIALGAGFNPILTGRENIYVNASVLGLSKREIDKKMDEIIDFAEIGDFLDSPVQSYSSGMQVRLGFAVATALEPDILLLDEVLAVGDLNFQAKCFQRLGELVNKSAVILVSHYPHHIKKMCDGVLLLERGEVFSNGSADKILATYQLRYEQSSNQPLLIFGNEIENAEIRNVSENICYGEYLEFDLVVTAKAKIKCDQAYLNIVDSAEIVHSQVLLTGFEKDYPEGKSSHCVRIGPLHLSLGTYSGNLMLCCSNGKTTLIHLRHCLNFKFVGPISLGPLYYPPSSVNEVRTL